MRLFNEIHFLLLQPAEGFAQHYVFIISTSGCDIFDVSPDILCNKFSPTAGGIDFTTEESIDVKSFISDEASDPSKESQANFKNGRDKHGSKSQPADILLSKILPYVEQLHRAATLAPNEQNTMVGIY